MRRVAGQSELFGEAPDRRPFQPRAVGESAHRQAIVTGAVEPQRARLRVITQLDPLKQHVVAVEEVTNGVARWRSCAADDSDLGRLR